MTNRFLTATHPKHGRLWAAIEETAHHVEPRVCERRFGAYLAPFSDEQHAAAALLEAGGTLDVEKDK